MSAFLADEFYAGCAFFGLDAVGRAAFATGRFDPRIALLDDDGLLFHRLADQSLGLFPHRLLRHRTAPVVRNRQKQPYSTRSPLSRGRTKKSHLENHVRNALPVFAHPSQGIARTQPGRVEIELQP